MKASKLFFETRPGSFLLGEVQHRWPCSLHHLCTRSYSFGFLQIHSVYDICIYISGHIYVQTVENFTSQSVVSGFLPPDGLDPEDPEDDPNPNPGEGLGPKEVLDWLPLQLNLQPRHLSLRHDVINSIRGKNIFACNPSLLQLHETTHQHHNGQFPPQFAGIRHENRCRWS